MIVYIILSKTPDINHKKDHSADLNALFLSNLIFFLFWYNISHIYDHKNGHHNSQIKPNGQMTIPSKGKTIIHTISHIVLPFTHRFVHHIFLVHMIGVM